MASRILVGGVTKEAAIENSTDGVLRAYASMLNQVAGVMHSHQTSLALRGFLHADDCVSYFHRETEESSEAFEVGEFGLRSYRVGVYLLHTAPMDEELVRLNQKIRRSPRRVLDLADYDPKRLASAGKVVRVEEFGVVEASQMHPLSQEQEILRKVMSTFGSYPDDGINEATLPIPQGASAIVTMFESLPLAIKTHTGHVVALAETVKKVAGPVQG